MRSLLILLFLSFSLASLTSQVEESFNHLTKTIDVRINGSPKISGPAQTAPPDMFPFYAILRQKDSLQPLFCGGTIIDVHHILTAASCLIRYTASQVVVTVGTHRYNSGGTNYTVSKITKHPEFEKPVKSNLNDVAILRINGSITFGAHVKAVKLFVSSHPEHCVPTNINTTANLPPVNFPNPSEPGVLVGWGNASTTELQYIQLPIVTYAECFQALNATHLKNFNVYAPNEFCTYKNHGKSGSCLADYGGPLLKGEYQFGIASWGGPCMLELPDVYTNVACYSFWINETIRIDSIK